MAEFNRIVATENTVNRIRVEGPAAPPACPLDPPEEDDLRRPAGGYARALAQRFYGKASLYPKIFEANRDVLDDPNLIKTGQKLRIPKV